MSRLHHRFTIYAKDVRTLTGRQRNAAYKLLRRIRKKFNLDKDALVTVEQFCSFTGFNRDEVVRYLREN